MIRDTEGYHPHRRTQPKTPVNAGTSRFLELQLGIGPGGRTRPVPASATAGVATQAGGEEVGLRHSRRS
jgi:hypothetical protein